MSLNAGSLLAGLFVSSIGLVLLSYGKKMGRIPQLAVGFLLLVFPMFVSSAPLTLTVGAVLLGALWAAVRIGL